MRKIYSLTIALLCVAASLNGQFNGVYTINSGVATGGTNYQTFTAFAAAINTAGVSGAVTVNVVASSGPYNEQVKFLQIPGASATNSIVINGNGCTLSFNATSSTLPYTLLLSGTDYMTVNDLNVVGLGATYALVCHLWSGADNNTFNGCTFTAPLNGTSTTQVPLSISGTSVSGTASGNSGSNNVVNTCTMSGGYYNTVFTGATTTPFNTGNQLLNSKVRDFYFYGFYNAYCTSTTVRGNVVERVNRTTISTGYGVYLTTNTSGALVEKNHVRRMTDGVANSTSAVYCFYVIGDGSPGSENVLRNNIVSDINSSGTLAGFYVSGGAYAHVFHNTVSEDYANATAGTTYGIYCTGPNCQIRNNIVTVTRGGTGTKYCLYLTTAATALTCNNNDLYMNAAGGVNYTGYLSAGYATLYDWQTAFTQYDANSKAADPLYTNPAGMDYVPTSTVINNMCPYIGVATDFTNFPRSLATPDPGAFEFYTTPCSGLPAANSVLTPSYILCPGTTLNIGLANTFTNTGYTVQWQASTTSSLGPFTPVSGATLAVFNTPSLTTTTWYNAVITCTVSSGFTTAAAGAVQIAITTTNTVPYYEGFEGISIPNQLPNCSWSGSSMGGSTLTYTSTNSSLRVPHSGSKFASFYSSPTGVNYFYSNGVYLQPGITYSAGVWYIAETSGFSDWSEFSINLGQTQTPSGLVPIAVANPASPTLYTPLSNTFVVTTPGLYYIAVKALSGGGVSPYLSWDDLSITIPCSLNSPAIFVTAGASTVCAGQPVSISAVGANSYTWSTGANTPSIFPSPLGSTAYYVIGSSSLTGCSSTVSQNIYVNPAPVVIAASSTSASCSGMPVTLNAQANGLVQYSWAHGGTGQFSNVNPLVTTSYSVIAVNGFGCTGMATVQVIVNPLPAVAGTPSSQEVCLGETLTLSAAGAATYQWNSGASLLTGNPVTVIPQASTAYTLTGTDANGCSGSAAVVVAVNECTGLNELATIGLRVFPNPANDKIVVVWTGDAVTASLTDISGRTLVQRTIQGSTVIDLSGLAPGVYNLALTGTTRVVKIIRQ